MSKTNKVEFWGIIGTNIAIVSIVIALFCWNRSESRSDYRELRSSTEAIINGIRDDIRDFHGRLCALEERNRR